MGWGGLPQVFDPKNEQWAAEYREMQGLLAPDIYAAARRSTQDAHYTSETVIRGIYEGLSRLGLGTGEPLRILEPSAGIGNFLGLCPEQFNANFLAVELDPTTSSIAQYLYPQAQHLNIGFQNSQIRFDGLDAVVGNPPFGKQSLYDPDFPELRKFSIHNYFLAKSISLLREGGIAAFVVSRYFMDAADPTAREHIAGQADLLGAIRLPETAFRQNALTDVTTDIVFFQKNSGEKLHSRDWVNTAAIEVDDLKNGGSRQAVINSYFLQNGDPCVVVLDEPNSNLDEEGEARLMHCLKRLKLAGRTVILVAHKPAVLAAMDEILVLREGGQIQLYGPRAFVMQKLATLRNHQMASARPELRRPQVSVSMEKRMADEQAVG